MLKGATGSKIVSTTPLRIVDMMKKRLQRPLEEWPDVVLQQLMDLAILVGTIIGLPSWGIYGLMKKSLNLLWQLDGGVHRLYSRVLDNIPSKLPPMPDNPKDSDDTENQTRTSQGALR
ncbi:hypothetical protein BGZ79_001789, partial [Entomortierella chlamydospora]